jgi:hypothetical protein
MAEKNRFVATGVAVPAANGSLQTVAVSPLTQDTSVANVGTPAVVSARQVVITVILTVTATTVTALSLNVYRGQGTGGTQIQGTATNNVATAGLLSLTAVFVDNAPVGKVYTVAGFASAACTATISIDSEAN